MRRKRKKPVKPKKLPLSAKAEALKPTMYGAKISFHTTAKEKRAVAALAKNSKSRLSDVMRDALDFYLKSRSRGKRK